MLKLRPYRIGSKSAKLLAEALRIKRIRPDSSYVPPARATVVNWGSSRSSHTLSKAKVLNAPQAVSRASNKLIAFQYMKNAGLSIPDFTTDKNTAAEWQEDGFKVVARKILTGHSGDGIVIAQPDDVLVDAPLYTKYTKKEKEYRVHVFDGRVIDVCEKRKRRGAEDSHPYVRTLNNGWVFCRTDVCIADVGKQLAIDAVRSLGLDFGAVDLIYRSNKHYVLEVNSAPGLQGQTLESYIKEFRRYV